jgi:hypothetical protein
MKTILILVAMIVIGLSGQAFARLGQTEEQVSALFGKPIDAGTPDKEGVTKICTRTRAVSIMLWFNF